MLLLFLFVCLVSLVFFFFLGGVDVPLVEFIYFVLTRMPGGGTGGDSGLCRCVSYLLSAITSFYL